MTIETLENLTLLVNASSTLSSRQKSDVGKHLAVISNELQPLAAADHEAAQSICNFLSCAIFESTRRERTDALAAVARKGMLFSFRPYEGKYPALIATAYNLGDVLSALGV